MLQSEIQVLKFVSKDDFKESLPDQTLLKHLDLAVNPHPEKTKNILRILLHMVEQGLHHQKGAIFSFGPSASDKTTQNILN